MTSQHDLQYWVSFSHIPGIGRVRINQLQEHFGNLEDAWKASVGELRKAGLDSKTAEAVVSLRTRISPEAEMAKLERFQVTVLPWNTPAYPQRLKEIYDYPPLLYIRGKFLPADECCLTVVGTRRATVYGRQVTEEIVADLARSGVTIVSGLARGIDAIAHRAALEAGGRSIAVFASGLDIVYPAENAKLAREIMENGVLVSEYPLGTRPKADNFPRRNRIMSGLSLGVLIVEAGQTSGALITANQALEQNREVFAIPGSILSPASCGCNRLIQEGAKLVMNSNDILEELNLTMAAKQLEMKEVIPVNETESRLLKELTAEPCHIDEVCRRSGLPIATVSSALTMMELKGLVKHVGNKNYVLAREIRGSS